MHGVSPAGQRRDAVTAPGLQRGNGSEGSLVRAVGAAV